MRVVARGLLREDRGAAGGARGFPQGGRGTSQKGRGLARGNRRWSRVLPSRANEGTENRNGDSGRVGILPAVRRILRRGLSGCSGGSFRRDARTGGRDAHPTCVTGFVLVAAVDVCARASVTKCAARRLAEGSFCPADFAAASGGIRRNPVFIRVSGRWHMRC